MVTYEPMSLRSSSSASTRLITTRSTNKSLLSASASLSPPPLPTTSASSSTSSSSSSSPSPLSSSSSSSIATSMVASTSNTVSPSMVITQIDSDTSSTSSLKRRRGRPLKSSQSADPSSSFSRHHNKKQHTTHNNHGHDLRNTTYKLDRLRLRQASSKDNLSYASPPAPVTANMIRMGNQVDAWKQDQGDYYRARIVEMEDVKVFVHYEGFPPDQADWIGLSDLRALDDTKQRKNRRQQQQQYSHIIYSSHSSSTSASSSTGRKASSLQQIDEPSQQHQYNEDDDDDDDDEDDNYYGTHHLHGGTIGGGKYGPKGQESNLSWQDYSTFYYTQDGTKARHHTGLVQDRRMGLHCCPCHSKEFIHPERPDRLSSILQQLHNDRILRYVKHMPGREATSSELSKAHTAQHIRNYTPEENKILKVTSIAALLNPVVSPPASPPAAPIDDGNDDLSDRPTTKTLRGIGGGVVIETKQGQLLRHQQRLFATTKDKADSSDDNSKHSLSSKMVATAATTAPTKIADSKSTYPPDLVCQMTCGELGIAVDTTFHPAYSSVSARVAAGALISLVDAIVQGQLNNGFALIRPPGHHAEDNAAMGFCFFNNVAVAALSTLEKYPTQIKKILIIDWDVHHGNGTQKIFYDNPNVLYISIHRWDHGQFYPYTGAPDECGLADGLGTNVNIAFSDDENQSRPMGDPEFVAAFYHLIVPIARQFAPDMIFVSAGFDAAEGHPDNLGGYAVTPRGFSIMTKIVKDLAQELCQGRLVLTLEGGYALQPLAISATASVTQLLPSWATLSTDYLHDYRHTLNTIKPNQGCVDSLAKCVEIQQAYWQLPEYLSSPTCRFQLPIHWRATEGILTRPKREKRPIKIPIVEGY
ncbi:hypothetical protein BCR42DRAFT_410896 [Absidia repens]|uniref:histone deacetylase n=1 Tax=Absidia repens TaxID=90262 RepID=A0A1X2IML1_9FUNG|nr:hypothetical protein BCR42DRAFT_410896 [Absidia repens]